MAPTAAILTHGWFATVNAKTAHGLVRGPSRFRIVGVIDEPGAGRDAGELLDGRARGIPVFASLDELLNARSERPDYLVVGVATPGGFLPPEFRQVLLAAVEAGLGLVNGLHHFLSDDAELAVAAARRGVDILDLRKPRPRAELRFWSGEIYQVRAPRLAVLGTDCALGKRTTAQLVADGLREQGLRAELIYTGQTGWLQGMRFGFILDTTVNDFISGELERAVVACDRETSPDLILLEGQSALRNPSGPCGSELLLSAAARGVILQHAPARRFFLEQEELGSAIPPLVEEVRLIELYGARVLGLALNHDGLAEKELAPTRDAVQAETGLPAAYPLRGGIAPLLPAVLDYLERERRR